MRLSMCNCVKTIIRDGSSIAVLSAYQKYDQHCRDAFDKNTQKHLQSGYSRVQFPHQFLTPDGLKGPEPLHCNWCRYSRGQRDNILLSLGGPRRIVRDSWDSQRQKGSQSIQDMAPNDPEQYSEGLPWPIFNSGAFDAKSYPVLVPWSCSLFITSHHCRLPVQDRHPWGAEPTCSDSFSFDLIRNEKSKRRTNLAQKQCAQKTQQVSRCLWWDYRSYRNCQ